MPTLIASYISSNIKIVLDNGFHGKVHSVFYRVVNIVDSDRLITITDETIGDVPNGIRAVKDGQWGFNDGFIRQGGQVASRNGSLVFCESGLNIDYSNATLISSRQYLKDDLLNPTEQAIVLGQMLEVGDKLAPEEGLCPLWHHVGAILENETDDLNYLSPMARVGYTALVKTVDGLKRRDENTFLQGIKKLAGLGAGLTPSGDDILTGLCGAYALLTEKTGCVDFMKVIDQVPALIKNATNRIAYSYVEGAVKGEITGLLSKFISVLVSGPSNQLMPLSKQLFSIGGTSGAELALGAFIGIVVFGETHGIV